MFNNNPTYKNDPVVVAPAKSDLPDNVYINLQIVGDDNNSTLTPYNPHKRMTFEKSFTQAYLQDPGEYYISCCTMSVSCHSVPMIYFSNIAEGEAQNNANKTDWVITFRYKGVNYDTNVIFTPSSDQPAPPAPSQNPPYYTQVYSTYYNLNNYQYICNMLNTALQTAWIALFAAPGVAADFNVVNITVNDFPYFIFDDNTEKFKLIYRTPLQNPIDAGDRLQLFLNDALVIKIPGLYTSFNGIKGNNLDYEVIFKNTFNNAYEVITTATTTNPVIPDPAVTTTATTVVKSFNVQQFAGSPNAFQTISQIIIMSNGVRARGEYLTTDANIGITLPSVPILFSLNPDLANVTSQKTRLTYTSGIGSGLRLSDLLGGSNELRTIDVSVYYSDNKGNLIPLYIANGEIAYVKLLFVRKSLINNW